MKTDHPNNRTTSSVDDDLDPLDTHVRIWLAEHHQRIARRGRHLVHRSGRGPWQPLAPSDLAAAITAPRIDPPNVIDLGSTVRILTARSPRNG